LLLLELHRNWAWFVIIGNGLAGLWSLASAQVQRVANASPVVVHRIVEVAIFVQVAMGVALVNKYKLQFPKFHAFYGFVAIIAVAIILQLSPAVEGQRPTCSTAVAACS